MHPHRRTQIGQFLLLLALSVPSIALAAGVPAALRGAILTKALSYEKSLSRGSGTLVIAVVGPTSGDGSSDASQMMSILGKLAAGGVAGREAKVVRVSDVTSAGATSEVKSSGADVAYVAEGLGRTGASVASGLSGAGTLVLCGDAENVGRGCTLSVEAAGSSSRLVVDVTTAKRGGFEFDARMLRLARVVR